MMMPMTALVRLALVVAVFAASPAVAQVADRTGSIVIERSVSVGNFAPIVPWRSPSSISGGAPLSNAPAPAPSAAPGPAPAAGGCAVVQITGDPGRLYRISVAAPVSTDPNAPPPAVLTIWSDTSGDISESQTGQLDANGQDTLRISAIATACPDDPDDEPPILLNLTYE